MSDSDVIVYYYEVNGVDEITGLKTSKRYIDFGVNLVTGELIILPQEPINCPEQGLEYDFEMDCYRSVR